MIKKSLFLSLLFLVPFFCNAQTGGFANLNDFGLPTYPYQFSRFWVRGSVPAGSNAIFELYGTQNFKFHTDSIVSTKLHLRNDGTPYKLISISNAGMFGAFSPSYILPGDTVGRWLGVGTTIPEAQVNSDWNSVSGVSQILNKPTIPAAQVNSDWNAGSGVAQILNKPTIPAAQVNSDWNSVSGVSQILNKPSLKRVETYLGTTDGSGNYTVTYAVPFSTAPDIQPQLQVGSANNGIYITSSTTTGFTVHAYQRAVLSLLGLELLAGIPTNLTGVSVGVLVTQR